MKAYLRLLVNDQEYNIIQHKLPFLNKYIETYITYPNHEYGVEFKTTDIITMAAILDELNKL